MGLGIAERRRIFAGSDLDVRFSHAEPRPPELRLAFYDADTGPRHFLDGTPHQLASWWRMFHARADELDAIAAEAKAELAKTKRAAKSVA